MRYTLTLHFILEKLQQTVSEFEERAHSLEVTFSPMDTPPEVMMTSARLIPSCRADSRSSGLQTQAGRIKAHQVSISAE